MISDTDQTKTNQNFFFFSRNNRNQLSINLFTAARATGTEKTSNNEAKKPPQKQPKIQLRIHYQEERVGWLAGIKGTEAALSVLSQRVAATATASPRDDGRLNLERVREQRTNKAARTITSLRLSLLFLKQRGEI